MKERDFSSTSILAIKEELEVIKVSLGEIRRSVGDHLNEPVVSLHGASISEAKALTIGFLDCLVQYSTETLPDLYRAVYQIQALTTRYEHPFEVFIGHKGLFTNTRRPLTVTLGALRNTELLPLRWAPLPLELQRVRLPSLHGRSKLLLTATVAGVRGIGGI
ncbi:hypothetical protein BCR41DRAFT_392730 [Lobosporangium transversale]|uniref:Uncharacterized protein n=1 Tax=Lobosporangium transversale TaxID=64571 RepID=A0A1Y2H032_9FUNG|nr:hypothetical protein BCR41DRAFT_392730 [Lobosporangium transversale]ORZ27404.1 hypothetical protein BCR41DRAFT_392730 [Lobosporangium transversale]|eukprot:XP_021885131.1 hypothetical protein BCR41DRAFT_392730 [Lobosporangium transversale]